MSKKELMEKLKLLNIKDKKKRNDIVCALIGHSLIQTACWGYFNCGRCNTQVGDSLAGIYSAKDVVIIDHNCKKCKSNYKKLTWTDKIYCPNPLK